ncbi:MAG: 50S ribosomal protein L35 [Bacteroidales bacterium]
MPKVKTNSSAKKRFVVTGTGKIMKKNAFKRHLLRKKTTKQKRHLTGMSEVSHADLRNVKLMLGL